MKTGDTILAPATPPGRSALAIIRLSGPGVPDILRARLTTLSQERGLHRTRLRLWNDLELPVGLLLAPKPASYTGESIAEILIPGNPQLMQRLSAFLLREHAQLRLAEPGEFTARAFLNGRMTIEQAEGVALAIASENDAQLAAARALLDGDAGDSHRTAAEEIARLLALVEAGIDFTDQEDVVPIAPDDLDASIAALCAQLDANLAGAAPSESLQELPRIVLVGRPNSGKSTLFNALLGRTRAVVSETPGSTRDALEETIPLGRPEDGFAILIDLAGLDESLAGRSDVERESQDRARATIAGADAIIHCDPSGRFQLPDLPAQTPMIRVRTKADLPNATSDAHGDLSVCALDQWNLPALRRAIADLAGASRAGERLTLLPRHRTALEETRDALLGVHETLHAQSQRRTLEHPERLAFDLRRALDAVGQIAGDVPPDDVIGRIFASFCVGK